jgi:hypothetical protein
MVRRLAALIALALCGGCGNARIISKTNAGGVIELKGDHDKAMEQAHYTMDAHCAPGNFIITYEGPEVIADDQPKDGEPDPQAPAVDTTRWRVYYRCSGQGPAPDPAQSSP